MTDFHWEKDFQSAFLKENPYEDYFKADEYYSDLPTLKHVKNSYVTDFNMFANQKLDFDPISTDNQSYEPEESCDAFNTEASTFAASPQFSGYSESDTNAIRETENCLKDYDSTDKASDIVCEILGTPSNQNDDMINHLEQMISADNAKLIKIIDRIFKGLEVTQKELDSFSFFEQAVIMAVLNKKRQANENAKKKKQKREEEKQKLFFKAVLKHTDKDFFKSVLESKKKIKRKQLDRIAYYELYWGEAAKKRNVDIAYFFHPNKKIAMGKTDARTKYTQNPWVKSLNTTYIELILSSNLFREVTSKYLENNFAQEYIKARPKKISKMLNKLQIIAMEAMTEYGNLPEAQQKECISQAMLNYVNTNPKCKLPWSDFEIKETKDYASSMIIKQQLVSESSEMIINGCNFSF